MGLSEREQQLLDEMERRLYQSEADVLQAPATRTRLNLRSLVLGILVLIAGLAMLITGVGLQQLWLGLVGFAVMLAGTLLAFSKREAVQSDAGLGQAPTSDRAEAKESLAERMNRRWDQRMEGER